MADKERMPMSVGALIGSFFGSLLVGFLITAFLGVCGECTNIDALASDAVLFPVWIISTLIGFLPQLFDFIKDRKNEDQDQAIKQYVFSSEKIEKFSSGSWDLNNPEATLNSMVSAQSYTYCQEYVNCIEDNAKSIDTVANDIDTVISDAEKRIDTVLAQLN